MFNRKHNEWVKQNIARLDRHIDGINDNIGVLAKTTGTTRIDRTLFVGSTLAHDVEDLRDDFEKLLTALDLERAPDPATAIGTLIVKKSRRRK